jgi:hypothetical protein
MVVDVSESLFSYTSGTLFGHAKWRDIAGDLTDPTEETITLTPPSDPPLTDASSTKVSVGDYVFAYSLPASPEAGVWAISWVATVDDVTDTQTGSFLVPAAASTYETQPLTEVNTEVFSLIESLAQTAVPNIRVYPEFPVMGVSSTCVVMQLMNSPIDPRDFQQVISNTKRGTWVRQFIQIDCYSTTAAECRTLTDAVFYGVSNNSAALATAGVRLLVGSGPVERPEFEIGSRLYKMSFSYGFQYIMTKSVSA